MKRKRRQDPPTVEIDSSIRSSGITLEPGIPICQADLPLDWYQEEFKPYAEEYLALPDRKPETVLPWMDRYVIPALDHFGDDLMLLAHFYMGGEIVKLVERYGGKVGDSYALALNAVRNPEITTFVESAVHFMAETIAILKHDHQNVWITNPKAGCTMEMMAKEDMIAPAFDELHQRYGDDLLVIAYMNTSGRVKSFAGMTGGSVCTSSNAHIILQWARDLGKKVLFVPDAHLGDNSGRRVGIPPERTFTWPGGWEGGQQTIEQLSPEALERLDAAELVLWGGFCGVHTVFQTDHIKWWQERGYRVLVHPECPHEVVDAADGAGSTKYLWDAMLDASEGDKIAIGTEAHFVDNAREQAARRGVDIVNLADIDDPRFSSMGCGCATMSRNDPPHLVAMMDLLRQGAPPSANLVQAGDIVDETTGWRERQAAGTREALAANARKALEKMIELTEAARS